MIQVLDGHGANHAPGGGGLLAGTVVLLAATTALLVWAFVISRADEEEPILHLSWVGTKAFLKQECPVSGPPSEGLEGNPLVDIVGAVGGGVFNAAYDALIAYVDGQIEEFDATYTARFAGNLFTPGADRERFPGDQCLVVVRGRFGASESGTTALPRHLAEIGLVEQPLLYVEIRLQHDKTHLLVSPAYIDYRMTAAERGRTGDKDLLLTVGFFSPLVLADREVGEQEGPFMFFTLELPDLAIGTRLAEPALTGFVMGYQPLPAATEVENDPVNFEGLVTVTETGEASLGFQILVGALRAGRDDITAGVGTLLTPD